ncbi:hypothetical protein JNUCC1_02838 [Lentibacillus sp. JNUCC-1]|nr:hypothetical protein [Lentibacillus sp. JNUCC-1]
MKPIIGITTSMELDEAYYKIANANVKAISETGGIPVILPHYLKEADIEEMANRLDGLYLTGDMTLTRRCLEKSRIRISGRLFLLVMLLKWR